MDAELEQYYEHRMLMLQSQGWKDLLDDIRKIREVSADLTTATKETINYRQGEISFMDWILSLEEVSEKTWKELREADDF